MTVSDEVEASDGGDAIVLDERAVVDLVPRRRRRPTARTRRAGRVGAQEQRVVDRGGGEPLAVGEQQVQRAGAPRPDEPGDIGQRRARGRAGVEPVEDQREHAPRCRCRPRCPSARRALSCARSSSPKPSRNPETKPFSEKTHALRDERRRRCAASRAEPGRRVPRRGEHGRRGLVAGEARCPPTSASPSGSARTRIAAPHADAPAVRVVRPRVLVAAGAGPGARARAARRRAASGARREDRGTRGDGTWSRAQASVAQRKPEKIWRRIGRSQLRNVMLHAIGSVAHDPPRSTL